MMFFRELDVRNKTEAVLVGAVAVSILGMIVMGRFLPTTSRHAEVQSIRAQVAAEQASLDEMKREQEAFDATNQVIADQIIYLQSTLHP